MYTLVFSKSFHLPQVIHGVLSGVGVQCRENPEDVPNVLGFSG